jgi:hypothetical protein
VYRLVCGGTVEERIVQRAHKKLYLDAVVTTNDAEVSTDEMEGMSKDELLSMIQFGSARIFKSDAATAEEIDIDAILANSRNAMKEEEARLVIERKAKAEGKAKKAKATSEGSSGASASASASSSSSSASAPAAKRPETAADFNIDDELVEVRAFEDTEDSRALREAQAAAKASGEVVCR